MARLGLAASLAIVLAGSFIETGYGRVPRASAGEAQRDIELFRTVVARVRAGSSYYEAMGLELRERRYPTASVFNWRPPLLYGAMAAVRPDAARAALTLLAGALLVLTIMAVRNGSTLAGIVALFIQLGAVVALLVPSAPLLAEAWAGVLIGLSLCAYRLHAWRAAAGLGLLALFVRELAAPYVLVSAFFALKEKRRSELVIWAAGAAAYVVYFAWHVFEVRALQQPNDLVHAESWLYWGGPAFLLHTLRTNAWLVVSPAWIPLASGLLALLFAACASPKTAVYLRATVIVYTAMFLVIGQPFNFYWGLLTAPMWGLAAAAGVDGLRDWLATAHARVGSSAR